MSTFSSRWLLVSVLVGCGGVTSEQAVTDAGADTSETSTSPTCTSPVGTLDMPFEMATSLCKDSSDDCKVCVQAVDEAGKPTIWSVLQMPSSCACPEPSKSLPSACPTVAPMTGTPCSGSVSCAYGYALVECGAKTVKCSGGKWAEVVHTDPRMPCGGCPSVALACDGTCDTSTPKKWDPAKGCLAKSDVVECRSAGTACTDAITCKVRSATGAAYWFPGDCHATDAWHACPSDVNDKVLAAKDCP